MTAMSCLSTAWMTHWTGWRLQLLLRGRLSRTPLKASRWATLVVLHRGRCRAGRPVGAL